MDLINRGQNTLESDIHSKDKTKKKEKFKFGKMNSDVMQLIDS